MRRLALTAAVLLALPVLFIAAPAYAATITVTTTMDVVDGADGLTSLREAITAANVAGGATTIELAADTYQLSLCGADEDANADGDLDYTASHELTIAGNGATIEQTCADQRVLHAIDDTGSVVIHSLTITGGEGFNGAAIAWAHDLTLQSVTVSGNDAGGGSVLSSDDLFASGPSLNLTDSTVGPNVGTGIRISFGTVAISASTITGNTERGVGLVDGALSVADSMVQDNGSDGLRTTGQGAGLLTVANSQVMGNGGVGVSCSACGAVEISDSVISGNQGGIKVNVDQDAAGDDLHVIVERSTVAGNTVTGPGGGLGIFITELSPDAPAAQITIDRSTFSGNSADGMDGRGGGVYAATGEVRVDNSTLDDNTAEVSGGGVFTSDGTVFLRHATVTRNAAPTGSGIATGADLSSFASIVAEGSGGTDCAIAGTTISSGYNIGGDGSCAFVGGPGDQNNAGDPQLGALQDNGGPTLTRQPLPGSPAVNAVPIAACVVFAIDQRGVARPQGPGCETGAVEIEVPAGGLPVTGTRTGLIVVIGLALVALGGLLLGGLLLRRARHT